MSHLLDFAAIPWQETNRGVRSKTIVKGPQQIRLVEFPYGLVEADWCEKGHTGYVIDGAFAIDYGGTIERYMAGDVLFIPRGEQDKHKAILGKNEKVTLLLFEILNA